MTRDGQMELPLDRLVRGTDPHTSLLAAQKASKASRKAIVAVAVAMNDGVIRIDEEVWATCRAQGYISSLSTVQHGRLALSEAGLLVETGATRHTRDGASSREWVRASGIDVVEAVGLALGDDNLCSVLTGRGSDEPGA